MSFEPQQPWYKFFSESLDLEGGNAKLSNDDFFKLDPVFAKKIQEARPWAMQPANKAPHNPHYFERVYVSAVALVKLLIHAQTGKGRDTGALSKDSAGNVDKNNWVEVMGLTLGYITEHALVITDSVALPTVGTEVETQMSSQAQSFLVNSMSVASALHRVSGVVGWYHTHPGLSVFLSNTDIETQRGFQMCDASVAFVLDPVRTLTTGKIELKAFRTYLPRYKFSDVEKKKATEIKNRALKGGSADILGRADDANYYELPITLFRSKGDGMILDRLGEKFWARPFISAGAKGDNTEGDDGSGDAKESGGNDQQFYISKLLREVNEGLIPKEDTKNYIPSNPFITSSQMNNALSLEISKNLVSQGITSSIFQVGF